MHTSLSKIAAPAITETAKGSPRTTQAPARPEPGKDRNGGSPDGASQQRPDSFQQEFDRPSQTRQDVAASQEVSAGKTVEDKTTQEDTAENGAAPSEEDEIAFGLSEDDLLHTESTRKGRTGDGAATQSDPSVEPEFGVGQASVPSAKETPLSGAQRSSIPSAASGKRASATFPAASHEIPGNHATNVLQASQTVAPNDGPDSALVTAAGAPASGKSVGGAADSGIGAVAAKIPADTAIAAPIAAATVRGTVGHGPTAKARPGQAQTAIFAGMIAGSAGQAATPGQGTATGRVPSDPTANPAPAQLQENAAKSSAAILQAATVPAQQPGGSTDRMEKWINARTPEVSASGSTAASGTFQGFAPALTHTVPIASTASPAPTIANAAQAMVDSPLDAQFSPIAEAALPQRTDAAGAALTGQPRADLPVHIARQMADAIQLQPQRPVDITLSPEELGRVRLALTTTETGLVLHVTAERPETLDLMRRHIAELGQEFLEIGYGDVAFSFSGNDTAQGDGSSSDTPKGAGGGDKIDTAARQTPLEIALSAAAQSGVDIRL